MKAREPELPEATGPGANYTPFVRSGNLLFISGQLSRWGGEVRYAGKVGRDLSVEDAKAAARLCALNLLAQLRVAVDGDWSRVVQCVRVAGFVNATDDFTAHSQVIDGASDALIEFLGQAGGHARIAVGVNSLPRGAAVEVEAVFELRP